MKCYIVTESESGVTVLKTLLATGLMYNDQVVLTYGEGWSGADALARSILVVRRQPVILLVDADSNDETRIAERKRFLAWSLGQFAPPEMFRIIVAVPELEALYFENKEVLTNLVGKDVTDEQFIRGKYVPRQVLQELFGSEANYRDKLQERLSHVDLGVLQSSSIVREVETALNELLQPMETESIAA